MLLASKPEVREEDNQHDENHCSVLASALEPLNRFLKDQNLIEVCCVKPGVIYTETLEGKFSQHSVPELSLKYWTRLCRGLSNNEDRYFDPEKQPVVSTKLFGNHRFEAMINTIVKEKLSVAIRLRRQQRIGLNAFPFGKTGTQIDRKAESHNWQEVLIEAVKQGQSIIISGGTSSGKTTLLRSLIEEIPLHKRVLTIEDTHELDIPHQNSSSFILSRNEKEPVVNWMTAINHLMRIRPDIIIAGELSMTNTQESIKLLNTGHRGFMTTVHSNSAQEALETTIPENICMNNKTADPVTIKEFLKRQVDMVIQVDKIPVGDSYHRHITEIWQPQLNHRLT